MVTVAQLAALREAYYSGTREVSYEGRRVVYQSMDELWLAIQRAEAALAGQAGRSRPRYGVVSFGRGR